MNRRGFLSAILAAGVAPAFVGSSILMPLRMVIPASYMSGSAMQALLDLGGIIEGLTIITEVPLILTRNETWLRNCFIRATETFPTGRAILEVRQPVSKCLITGNEVRNMPKHSGIRFV